jgi:hypothetical protein
MDRRHHRDIDIAPAGRFDRLAASRLVSGATLFMSNHNVPASQQARRKLPMRRPQAPDRP